MLKLKEIRERKELKQSDVAKILNITQQQYSMYENEIRLIPINHVIKLANYYNVTTDYILGITKNKYKEND